MRIGIGLSYAWAPHGIGASQRAMLEGFAAASNQHQYFVFGAQRDLEIVPRHDKFATCEVAGEQLRAHVEAASLDVYHGPVFSVPLTRACPTVVTVHDTLMLANVDNRSEALSSHRKKMIAVCGHWANRVVAVSHYVSDRIADELHVDTAKIDVVPNGILNAFFELPAQPVLPPQVAQLGLRLPFVMYAGGTAPRKNVRAAIDAWHSVRSRHGLDVDCVIVNGLADQSFVAEVSAAHAGSGSDGPMAGESARRDGLIITGALSVTDLVALYSLASVFIYPSLDEGFGLPPIEAMARGVPVVASNRAALPEVVGDAALLVDPLDVQALADAVAAVLEDASLASRLRSLGFGRARQYTASRMAATLLDTYERACAA